MPVITNVSDAKASLSKLLEQVECGQEIIIGRSGKPIAILKPYQAARSPRKPGMGNWKGKIVIAKDFDVTPEEFLRDLHGEVMH